MLNRVVSPLPQETEDLLHRIIGCALEVHTRLGPGYVEAVYQKAMCVELRHQGLAFSTEHTVKITYRDEVIHGHRVDLVVEGLVVLELKSVQSFDQIHKAQLVSYLRALNVKVGLLINFNTHHLRGCIRRVVL
jgi:GxxExxY protein